MESSRIFQVETKELVSQPPFNLDTMPKSIKNLEEDQKFVSEYLQLPPESLAVLKETHDVYSIVPSMEGDVYQFGMLLYQILFYRRPFRERKEDHEGISFL